MFQVMHESKQYGQSCGVPHVVAHTDAETFTDAMIFAQLVALNHAKTVMAVPDEPKMTNDHFGYYIFTAKHSKVTYRVVEVVG